MIRVLPAGVPKFRGGGLLRRLGNERPEGRSGDIAAPATNESNDSVPEPLDFLPEHAVLENRREGRATRRLLVLSENEMAAVVLRALVRLRATTNEAALVRAVEARSFTDVGDFADTKEFRDKLLTAAETVYLAAFRRGWEVRAASLVADRIVPPGVVSSTLPVAKADELVPPEPPDFFYKNLPLEERILTFVQTKSANLVTFINAEMVVTLRAAVAGNIPAAISEQAGIRYALVEGFGQGLNPREIARTRIRPIIGLNAPQARAVANMADKLKADGMAVDEIAQRTRRYSERLLRQRAETIARTEMMSAVQDGKREYMEEVLSRGAVRRTELQRTWLTAADERVCPVCLDLGGLDPVPYDEPFKGSYGEIFAPPAHPNCRCDIAIEPI